MVWRGYEDITFESPTTGGHSRSTGRVRSRAPQRHGHLQASTRSAATDAVRVSVITGAGRAFGAATTSRPSSSRGRADRRRPQDRPHRHGERRSTSSYRSRSRRSPRSTAPEWATAWTSRCTRHPHRPEGQLGCYCARGVMARSVARSSPKLVACPGDGACLTAPVDRPRGTLGLGQVLPTTRVDATKARASKIAPVRHASRPSSPRSARASRPWQSLGEYQQAPASAGSTTTNGGGKSFRKKRTVSWPVRRTSPRAARGGARRITTAPGAAGHSKGRRTGRDAGAFVAESASDTARGVAPRAAVAGERSATSSIDPGHAAAWRRSSPMHSDGRGPEKVPRCRRDHGIEVGSTT